MVSLRGTSRRDFLAWSGALGAASLIAPGSARATTAPLLKPIKPARNLIFMVSDGMSAGTLQLADLSIRQAQGRPSRWAQLIEDPRSRRALVRTHAANSLVTDSAAASTAWGTGELVNNGAIGLTPDGRMPTPILMHARQQGRAIGLVTTTRLTHATPAGFLVNSPADRDREEIIAAQIMERLPEVALGGGSKFLTPEVIAARPEARVVRTRDELLAAPPDGPLLGVFSASHMSYELDRRAESLPEPSLIEMARAALDRLSASAGGFVIQIEGGRVDHAGHSNDAGSLIAEQVMFDETLGVLLDFVRERDDTLLIVTTDHATANPGLTDYGEPGNTGFEKLGLARRSFEWIGAQLTKLGRAPEADAVRSIVREASGLDVGREDLDFLMRRLAGQRVDPFVHANDLACVLGSLLANQTKVAFLSANHTADSVELTAIGPGAEVVPPIMHAPEVHGVMVKALDLAPARAM